MWASPYLMCVPCVQEIAKMKRVSSSDSLKWEVQWRETWINNNVLDILAINEELDKRKKLDCKYRDVQPLSTNLASEASHSLVMSTGARNIYLFILTDHAH